ncbi:molybdopterin molybdotransferase MoeA [Acidiphilium sp.]|uniref:molybdopterin molybdotransferase MoeA n=1 Tax=Acidiphilium sp. TaxID=527 RepID=UPI003D05A5E5
MLSVTEARDRILALLAPTGSEIVTLAEAAGRVLAAPVVARLTQPPLDVSAMDGFALRAADATVGARLRIIGAAPAGHPFAGSVGAGEAVRLFTGSVVPSGADCIVIQEDTTFDDDVVILNAAGHPGKHVRGAGLDFTIGDVLLEPGRRLTARDIGLAAAANHPWLTVHRKPIIAVLATGDEIAMPGDPIPPGGIVSSNSHALAGFIRAVGGVPIILPIALDDRAAIATAAQAAARADLLITTGGASVGTHDLVQAGLADLGLDLDFWKIAMRPGKPLMFGRLGALPVLGLPGNPVSAMVCALLFGKPAIERLCGLPGDPPPSEPARCTIPLAANDQRADHLRATLTRDADGSWLVTPFGPQDSSLLRRLALADAVVLRAPYARAEPAGTVVDIIRLAACGL